MRGPVSRALGAGLLALALGGCGAYEESVALFIPLHRLELPEKPYRGITAGQSLSSAGVRVGLTDAQSSVAPDPVRPAVRDEPVPYPIAFAELYPLEWLSLAYDWAEFTSEERHAAIRVKAHLLGPRPGRATAGDLSLALTYAYADNGYDYRGMTSRTSFQARGDDVALVAGWRAYRWLLLYGGPYRHDIHYRGMHLSDGNPDNALQGRAELTGFNAGLCFNPGVRWMSLLAEYSQGHVRAGESAADEQAVNGALRFNFGWRQAAAPRDGR